MTWLLAILSFTSLMLYKVQATHMSTACGLESVNWFPSKPGMLWNSSPEKGGGIACKKSAIIRVIRHNWMLQGSFNSIFSPANICYGGDGIRTWNEEGVSRCTLFSSQVSQYTTDGLERARDKTALLKQLLPSLILHRQALGSMH